jgi:hypothetical protein
MPRVELRRWPRATSSPARSSGPTTKAVQRASAPTSGRTVTVRGSDVEGTAATTVDRTFEVGVRYEVHPLEDASPCRDDACTAIIPRVMGASSPEGSIRHLDRYRRPMRSLC